MTHGYESGRLNLPFIGICTFGKYPYVQDWNAIEADIAVLGAPLDMGTQWRAGARFGPRAIREASTLFSFGHAGAYDHEDDVVYLPADGAGIVDIGDADIVHTDMIASHAAIELGVRKILAAGAIPVVLGGDHSVNIPCINAFDGEPPVHLVQIDAHLDFVDERHGVRYGHGNPMRRAAEKPYVTGLSQIGIRNVSSTAREGYEDARAMGSDILSVRQARKLGTEAVLERIPARARYYLTIDIDGFDPSIAPGTGTPSHGGFLYYEVLELLDGLSRRGSIVGVDLVEVAPDYDHTGTTAILAAQILMNLIGRMLHHRPKRAGPGGYPQPERKLARRAKSLLSFAAAMGIGRLGEPLLMDAHTIDPTAKADGEPPQGQAPQRKIIHIDMDAFFASVEQRDHPELRGKPVAVGGSAARGVVAAASYEARKFGVRSAMPSVTAKRRCPDLIFVKHRFDVYKQVSQQVRAIFAEYTHLIEPLSLDEAYLDVTENLKGIGTATEIAEAIRAQIRTETGLTASAGVSYNKFLAKLASDHRKPDGLFVITPKMGQAFVETLPVGKFHGVGPATTRKMNRLGIHTGADLRGQTLSFLNEHFGKSGQYYYWIARGIDERPVRNNRVRKSVGAENTFFEDLAEFPAMREALQPIFDKLWRHCEAANIRGRTVTLKMKFSDFQIITRRRTLTAPVCAQAELEAVSLELLALQMPVPKGVRLLGVTLSSLDGEDEEDEALDQAQMRLQL